MLVNSILSLVVLTLLVFLSIQIIKQLRLISLKKNAVDQPDLYKKISIYELKLFKKQFFYLLVINGLITIALVFCIYMLFELQNARINDHRTILNLVERIRELNAVE
ncbi:hypothetical protein [Candidatus Enterococcus mangumiae]|uniref:Uncharacterized protein n=1 Tax=Candidatus Enterococcus mangumiae TaxID=2230878 RepID=A0ABZ2SW96_9ENTE|nr:hypothetical protein [Enterococcus sp. DIV1094]MBO0490249.1 hypothetical protein [Enterococcus sp. DIV1094]